MWTKTYSDTVTVITFTGVVITFTANVRKLQVLSYVHQCHLLMSTVKVTISTVKVRTVTAKA